MTSTSSTGIAVVLPAHNEASCLPDTFERLRRTLGTLGRSWRIVVVDDGSTDGTWSVISEEASRDPAVRGIRLSRNYGHQAALTAGLAVADAECVVTMDADLQHPPEVIPSMIEQIDAGFDVVYAVRAESDSEGWFKVNSAELFYRWLNRLTELDLPRGAADFRAMRRVVVDALVAMPERNRFLRGMTRWVGFAQTVVEYERGTRHAGDSKYTFRRMLRFGLDAILGFSALPLRVASHLGFVISCLGAVYLLYVVGLAVFDVRRVEGWSSVLAAILTIGGISLVCLGIIGQYLSRMYDELKARPLFLVWDDTDQEQEGTARFRSAPPRAVDPAAPTPS